MQFDEQFLQEMGLSAMPEEQKRQFLDYVQEELEVRIGVSKAEICAIHPDISPTTVEAVLGRMVKGGSIKRIGVSKGARYINNP